MTEVKAYVRHLRMSPRKVRLPADLIRGMNVEPALAQLSFMSKAAATPVKKLLESAIANATHNFKLNRGDLFVKTIFVGQGPSLKRFRPRAMGSAAPILKRSCHISIVLSTRDGAAAPAAHDHADHAGHDHADHEGHDHAHEEKKPAAKKTTAKHAPSKAEGKPAAKKAVKK